MGMKIKIVFLKINYLKQKSAKMFVRMSFLGNLIWRE